MFDFNLKYILILPHTDNYYLMLQNHNRCFVSRPELDVQLFRVPTELPWIQGYSIAIEVDTYTGGT